MNQQQRYQQRPQRQGQRNQQRGNQATDNGEQTLDQYAGAMARGLIKQTGVEDTTQIWRALKRAFLAGYEAAQLTEEEIRGVLR